MTKPFDINKPCKYRNGTPARILCSDRPEVGGRSLLSMDKDGGLLSHFPNGSVLSDGREYSHDLINIPQRIKLSRWVAIHRNNDGTDIVFTVMRSTKNEAGQLYSGATLLACTPITIDCEEGEGL